MSRFAAVLAGLLSCFLAPLISFAQQADAPVYQEGDWWRVKVEVARPDGSLSCRCATTRRFSGVSGSNRLGKRTGIRS